MKEPVDHILRQNLPWRSQDDAITECGHNPASVKTITAEQFKQREKDFGKQRAAMLTCMTCSDALKRWERGTSGDDPRRALGREIEWECGGAYWHVRDDRGHRLKDELLAAAQLIGAHREEFDALKTAIEQRREWLEQKAALERKRPKQKGPGL